MCEIKKMIFSVSEKGNALCKLWVDEDCLENELDAKIIAIRSQVAFLFFQGTGSKIELKKSNQYWNVIVPETFTNIFENYKISQDANVKIIGNMLNVAFNNAFNSLSYLKNGEITLVSKEEADNICSEYLSGYFSTYNNVLDILGKSKNKALKSIAKVLDSDTSKPSDIKEANAVVVNYVNLAMNFLNKQHLKVDN